MPPSIKHDEYKREKDCFSRKRKKKRKKKIKEVKTNEEVVKMKSQRKGCLNYTKQF